LLSFGGCDGPNPIADMKDETILGAPDISANANACSPSVVVVVLVVVLVVEPNPLLMVVMVDLQVSEGMKDEVLIVTEGRLSVAFCFKAETRLAGEGKLFISNRGPAGESRAAIL